MLLINFHAPATPTLRYHGGRAEEFFPSTAGWGWLEGKYLGEAAGDDAVVTLLPPRELPSTPVNATVLVGEALAAGFFEMNAPVTGKILVRVISPPGSAFGIWKTFAVNMPRIGGLCTISEDTAQKLDIWARTHGYKGPKVRCVRHGAPAHGPPDLYVGDSYSKRHGVAYLGSLIHEKRVPIVVEAAKTAGVPCFLGVSVNSDRAREDIAAISELAKEYDGLSFATLGEIGKYEVLSSARVVVTASMHEAAWVSGIEGRAAGCVAVAPLGDGCIKRHNDDGLLYYDGTVDGLAAQIKRLHEDDEFFLAEQKRQHARWKYMGHAAGDVGKALWEWIKECAT